MSIIQQSRNTHSPVMDADNSNTKKEVKGLECAVCGCQHFSVIYTRPSVNGKIMRRRECRHCNKRVTTYEQIL